jgi:Rhodopirellula transposase DDE domain
VEQNRAPPLSFISQNWRALPRVSYPVIVELIWATTTKTGLTVRCELDTSQYPRGIVVSDAEIASLNIRPAEFHGEWNCAISSNISPSNCAFISQQPLRVRANRTARRVASYHPIQGSLIAPVGRLRIAFLAVP